MEDENRFKKLELRPGVLPASDERVEEKSRKEQLRELDHKNSFDQVVDRALDQEQQNTTAFNKKAKILIIAICAVSVVLFLAEHHVLGFDGIVEFAFKICVYAVFPIALLRWVLGK